MIPPHPPLAHFVLRTLVIWVFARALYSGVAAVVLSLEVVAPSPGTSLRLALATAGLLILDILRRRERVLLADLGVSLLSMAALAMLTALGLETGLGLVMWAARG